MPDNTPYDPRPGWVRQRTYELQQTGLSYDADTARPRPKLTSGPTSERRPAERRRPRPALLRAGM
jgi:hypothetical protein